MITLNHWQTYHGPSLFATDPVIVVDATLPILATEQYADAMATMSALSVGWFPASPATGDHAPTSLVALGQFLAGWSLEALTHVNGYLHACGAMALSDSNDTVRIWLGYHNPLLSFDALKIACSYWLAALEGNATPDAMNGSLHSLWNICRQQHPDYQARIIMEAAKASGIPFAPAWQRALHWQYGWGARSRVMFESSSAEDGYLGANIAVSKAATKLALVSLGIPTPKYVLVNHEEGLAEAVGQVGFPCVTKPINRGGGKGITAGLNNLAEVQAGFAFARQFSAEPIMVEQFVSGEDHRLMVIDGRLAAVIRREAAIVVGDGHRTIGELVDEQNATRSPISLEKSNYLRPIALDGPALQHLAGQGVDLNTVLEAGRSISLRGNANLSTGGFSTDVTDLVHPDIRVLVESLARTLSVRVFCADYLTTDIARSPQETGGTFIEINLTPGLEVLVAAGWTTAKVGGLALGELPGRIPVDLLILPDAIVSEVEWQLKAMAPHSTAGWASHNSARLGGVALQVQMSHPWAAVSTLLAHRLLQNALIVCSSSYIQQHGLPVDRADRTWLCDAGLPAEWIEVSNRHSNQFTGPLEAGKVETLLDQWSRQSGSGQA